MQLSLDRLGGINGLLIKPTADSDVYSQVSGAKGDINDDGLDDLLLGSPQAYSPVVSLNELIDRPYPFGDSDQTGLVTVVFGTARAWRSSLAQWPGL
jgi:hypothetical protein